MAPPGPFRIPLIAINRLRVRASYVADCIKRMDGHIRQKNMVHSLAEPPEMSWDKKINVHCRDFSDQTLIQQAPDFPHCPDEICDSG